MGALAGILNYAKMAGQALPSSSASPLATAGGTSGTSATTGSSSSSSSSATISANDFLSLLVTEMQNQDPTADTDPNEYINQLVQVNSLEQLIDINQNLTTALGTPTTDATTQATAATTSASSLSASSLTARTASGATPAAATPASVSGSGQATSSALAASGHAAQAAAAKHAPGNLNVPDAKPAAHQVAHALDGHSRSTSKLNGIPLNR
jgi:flagellar basal-body rod modification protein FlgD